MYYKWIKLFFCFLIALVFDSNMGHAQASNQPINVESFQVYKVWADAKAELKNASLTAQKSNKQILVIVGGNWCVWCRKLHNFMEGSSVIQNVLKNFVVVHINYSKENKNEAVLSELNNPQQYGFPVCVLLDKNGNYMLTQPTSNWEEGRSYSEAKISAFLSKMNINSINKTK